MFKEYQLHTDGDEEGLGFTGVAFAERMSSVLETGGFATSREVKVIGIEPPEEHVQPEPIKYGSPYTGPDYRDVVL